MNIGVNLYALNAGEYSKENAKEKYCPNCGALMRTY